MGPKRKPQRRRRVGAAVPARVVENVISAVVSWKRRFPVLFDTYATLRLMNAVSMHEAARKRRATKL